MRLAWFRSRPDDSSDPFDPSAAALRGLRQVHAVTVYTPANAPDFAVRAFHEPFDLCVYELDGSAASDHLWPHIVRVPGLLVVGTDRLHDGRARLLERLGRGDDYRQEFTFNHAAPPPAFATHFPRGRWPMSRVAVLASRLVATWDTEVAVALETRHGRPVRVLTPAVEGPAEVAPPSSPAAHTLRVAVLGLPRPSVAGAMRRAGEAGTTVTLLPPVPPGTTPVVPAEADVVVALQWPAAGEPLSPALAGMAAGRPVLVLECEATARWAALDPQTWQPRDRIAGAPPAVVAIDPRDEEHSLLLAFRRLAADPALRATLGRDARACWQATATPAHGLAGWEAVLAEAAAAAPPALPADWPAHLAADGTGSAREALRPFGLDLDDLLGR